MKGKKASLENIKKGFFSVVQRARGAVNQAQDIIMRAADAPHPPPKKNI